MEKTQDKIENYASLGDITGKTLIKIIINFQSYGVLFPSFTGSFFDDSS